MTGVAAAQPVPVRALRRRTVAAALAAVPLIVLVALLVEPTLLRPLIRHVVATHSGRTIDFSAMRVGVDAGLEPWLEFDDLVVENAPWTVSREPLVRARRLGLDLVWDGLRTGVWTVKRLVLEDAAVDLERAPDGRRNARLSTPDGRGPSRARVLSIDGRRSRLQIHDGVTGLELRITSTPLAAPRTLGGRAALPLTRTLAFEGRQHGTAFGGHADVSDVVTLQRTGLDFALQGEIHQPAARLTVSGSAGDILVGLKVDADLHLEADPLSGLHLGLLPRLPALRDVSADGHLVRDPQRWALTRVQARSRGSEVGGELEFHRDADRPRLAARLAAPRLDIDEWLGVARGTQAAPAGVGTITAPARFDPARLRGFDAALELSVGELRAAKSVVARGTRLSAALDRGGLRIAVPASGLAGGTATGELRFDASSTPASASLSARVADLRLGELPPAWRPFHRQLEGGRMGATVSLAVRGTSVTEWIASATGTAQARLDGATVSDRLEAKLGLNGLAFLRSLLTGASQVPLRCAEAVVELHDGRGPVRRLTLDSAHVAVAGSGSIDLVGRTVDLLLAPSPHGGGSLFALDRDIRVRGSLVKPSVSLQSRSGGGAAPAGCAASGAVQGV